VIYLHGSGGLKREDLDAARPLANAGFITVVVCWAQTPGCARSPANDMAAVDAIIRVAKALPQARPDRVGLVGVSLGGWEVFQLLARRHDLAAGVADSAESGVDPAQIDTPILILAPEADMGVPNSRQTEGALRAAGKAVEAHYYADAGHVVIANGADSAQAMATAIDFLHRHMG
jgi:dienelactone hydrolase